MSKPTNWKSKSLFSLAGKDKARFDDGDWIESEFLSESGIRFLQTGNIGVGLFIDKTAKKFISEESFNELRCKDVFPGDVLICRLADPAGRACIVPVLQDERAVTAVDVTIFRPLAELIDRHYLVHFLCTSEWFADVNRLGAGSTRFRISRESLGRMEIPLPPMPEQIEIARILGVWDAAIGDTAQLIAAKTERKRGLMQQLLTGDRRFAEFEGQAFVSKPIGEVMELQSRLVTWDDEATYRLASVRRNSGGLFWREALRGDQIKVKKLHTVRTGDFLISHIQAAYGAMGCVPDSFDGGHVSDMYSILTPRKGAALDIRFVNYLSQTPVMHKHILQSSNGFFAERLRLNFDPLEFLKRKLDLPPTLEEQRRIADVLDAATREIDLLKEQLSTLKTQKRGLMQGLLSGEVPVTLPAP